MTPEQETVIAIFGPTAVGKTEVAIALAESLAAAGQASVAVAADAYQLYDGLPVLSGAPGPGELDRLEHRLVGSHPITEEMSAGRYAREAHTAIDDLLADGVVPIVVGGAGLYMQAALTDLDMRPELTAEQEADAEARYTAVDTRELHAALERFDAEAASAIDTGDRYRTIRALALHASGQQGSPGTGFWDTPMRRPTLLFGLERDREELYSRIDSRVEAMVAGGAAEEVANASGASPTARRIIGFDELPSGDIDGMKARTRRYAKRQLTWMRRMPSVRIIDLSQSSVAGAAEEIARSWREERA